MIIITLNQLKQHIPVGNSLSFETLLPYIREAEEAILAPNIGEELLTQIDNYLQADTLTDIQKELLKRTQLVAARFALSYFIPNGEVIIGDDGITTVGKGEARTAAYDRQIVRLQESTSKQAWDSLDRLLSFLEKNATEFPAFLESEAYTRYQRGLVRNTQTFNDIYYIANSRLTFQAIHPELMNVEEDRLIPLITREHYDIIHAGGALDENYSRLLSLSRKAIIFQAVANVIQLQQNVSLDAATLRVYGSNSAGDNVQYYQKPTERDRNDAAAKAQARADMYFDALAEIISDIEENGDDDFTGGIMGDQIVMF